MIRFAALDLLILLAVGVGLYLVYRSMIQKTERKKLNKIAYFSGGPLDGTKQQLSKLPKTYTYMYDRPQLVKGTEGSPFAEAVPCWYNALYKHEGLGVYEYQGSTVINASQVTYDPNEDG